MVTVLENAHSIVGVGSALLWLSEQSFHPDDAAAIARTRNLVAARLAEVTWDSER